MKVSEFLECLPDLIREWRKDQAPVASRVAQSLEITRQSYSKREQRLETAELPSLIELVRAIEKQSRISPDVILMSPYGLTGKGSKDSD